MCGFRVKCVIGRGCKICKMCGFESLFKLYCHGLFSFIVSPRERKVEESTYTQVITLCRSHPIAIAQKMP
jgi:hypothetical protein